MKFLCITLSLLFFSVTSYTQPLWQAKLDGKIAFYQTTDFGVVLAATDNSLYSLDGQTGQTVWRLKHRGLDETSIVPVPETDLILISIDKGDKSELHAVDLVTGETLWKSEKVKGDVMQLAADPDSDLLAVTLAKKAHGRVGDNIKRKPVVHVLRLSTGAELWKKELDSDIAMMPAEFATGDEVNFTLDNYRAPLILDGRLYLFYEGATSYDAQTGSEKQREKFKVNEDGLALTEADPIFDNDFIYASGRGKIRAINRKTGETAWEAKDLGVTPEMTLIGSVLYVRTGGQFTRLKDGETEEKGPFGISAIDARNGKTLWRWKGGDKGITNYVFRDANTILLADRDDLISIDAKNGKRLGKAGHKVEKAQFVVLNESGEAVVGGKDEIAAFGTNGSTFTNVWRVKHKVPGRGIFRIVGAIALRAAAIYFRYGGLASSAFSFGRSAINLRSALRWSGLRTRFSAVNLTTLAANSAQNYLGNRVSAFGLLGRARSLNGIPNLTIQRPNIVGRIAPSRAEIQESVWDRLDPASQAEKLSNFLLKRKRVAEMRGNYMYFYTELPKPFDRKGLVGVNIHTGRDARRILVSDPDARFVTDEITGLLYSADGNRLQAFDFFDQ